MTSQTQNLTISITPPPHNGNRYILTLSDYFTKWVKGLPQVLTTDQGTEFCNQLNEELIRSLGIQHHVTTAQVTYAQQSSCTACL